MSCYVIEIHFFIAKKLERKREKREERAREWRKKERERVIEIIYRVFREPNSRTRLYQFYKMGFLKK